ncbi:hypothetical protein [Bacillus sp. FSL K6-3431]|uniref:hypothetical protein n=1 Tax=Bacillus sp. FSL K6-3431 TaxID=2921500 RepID=UPI0030F7FBD5
MKQLEPITNKFSEFEKEEVGDDADDPTPEETLIKQFGEVLEEKLTPLNERLNAVEKARGISKQADEEGQEQVTVQKHYLDGFL